MRVCRTWIAEIIDSKEKVVLCKILERIFDPVLNFLKLEAEKLRDAAVEDLDTLQKRTQFELIGLIVKSALYVIIGVGLITTGLYVFAMTNHYDTKILESSWSNMFGILLTNSFSIIGTIMGVKYATDNSKKTENK